MAAPPAWRGITDRPRSAQLDPSEIDHRWDWALENLVAAWIFAEQAGDTVRDALGRTDGSLSAGSGGSKPVWEKNGALWGLKAVDGGDSSGVVLPNTNCPLGDNFTPEQLTLETWGIFGRDALPDDPRIFAKNTTTSNADHWIMWGYSGGAGSESCRCRLKTGGTTIDHRAHSNDRPNTGDLVHIAWTYDGAAVECRQNAALSTMLAGGSASGTVDGGTGVPMKLLNSAFAGAVNENVRPQYKIAIYRTAFQPWQIAALNEDPWGPHRPRQRSLFVVPADLIAAPTLQTVVRSGQRW